MNNKSLKRLPLIPLSPLTQISIEYAKALAQTTRSLSETNATEIISQLNKDLFREREKLDRLTKNIQHIQSQFLADQNVYEVAKEISYIDCSLFRLVMLDKIWISNFDKQSNIVPLLDFHRYLSHSFAHQVIYSADVDASKKTARRKSILGGSNSENTIAQLIQLAYILLHIYRDFSGCAAILTSLKMPEVQRLETLWNDCPSRLIALYKELVVMLSPHNNFEAYQHYLWLHTARFLNEGTSTLKSQMIAVPFMHAHLTTIQNLIQTHSMITLNSKQNVVLLDSGKKIFLSIIRLLEFCQQHAKIDIADLEVTITSRRLSQSSSKSRRSSINRSLKLSVPVCLELDKLSRNSSIYHWLVSRAYLTRSQLHHESLQIVPLAIGEIDLETEEDYDLYWEFFSQTAVMKEPLSSSHSLNEQQPVGDISTKQPDVTVTKNYEINQDMVDDLVIVTSSSTANISTTNDDNGVVSISTTPTTTEDSTTNIEPIKDEIEEQELLESNSISDGDNETDIIIVEDQEESLPKSCFGALTDSSPTNDKRQSQESQASSGITTSSSKPVLSPSALEFVPQQYNASNIEEEEEDDEEWRGYPVDNSSVSREDEDDEIWTGYPIKEADDDDEEEVWKGYPGPQKQSTSPVTPYEVWKGYQKTKKRDYWDSTNAIGKAAARKMQYSISKTDTRKRLPASFAPSAST